MFNKGLDVVANKIDWCYEDEWEEKEKNLIFKYRESGFNLLNIDVGGRGVVTAEKRNKSGIIRSSEAHEIKIVQLDLSGNYIKTWDSTTKASKELGLSTDTAINNVLKGRSKTSCDCFWFYEKDYLENNYILPTKVSPKERLGKKYYQYSPDTNELIKFYESERDVFYEVLENRDTNSSGLLKAVKEKTIYKNYY